MKIPSDKINGQKFRDNAARRQRKARTLNYSMRNKTMNRQRTPHVRRATITSYHRKEVSVSPYVNDAVVNGGVNREKS
jgi:hypothetical protein